MKKIITVVEDLVCILPVKEESEREATKDKALTREEEEVSLIFQEPGLENDQEPKAGNRITRGGPLAYGQIQGHSLLRYGGRVNL
jgi:hypothetical protein